MKSRIKVALSTLETRDDAELCLGELALITLNQIRTTAKMDAELAAVRQKYEGYLSQMAEELKKKTDDLHAWADANPDQFPKGRKSIVFTHGTLGFHTGPPKVALLNRAWSWKKVLSKLITLGGEYIRTKEEVDKDSILAHYSGKSNGFTTRVPALTAADLAERGMRVRQEESFFIEPLITPVEPRQTTEAA
jgi:phage host-nuclease inhibitor protein Gam